MELENSLNLKIGILLKHIQKAIFKSTYCGIPSLMSPIDYWIYSEIVYEVKPTLIIEIGIASGGSLLALSHMIRNISCQNGRVIGIDITDKKIDKRLYNVDNIDIVIGNCKKVFNSIEKKILHSDKVIVIDDSSHTYSNTLFVLNNYANLVTKDSYMIVEDTICGHGLKVGPRVGPYKAVHDFIMHNDNFEIDRSKERFLITWNPCGYLKRIR